MLEKLTHPGMLIIIGGLLLTLVAMHLGRRNQRRDALRADVEAATEQAQYATWGPNVPPVDLTDFIIPPIGATLYVLGTWRKFRYFQGQLIGMGVAPDRVKNIQYPHHLDHLDHLDVADDGLTRFALLDDGWELPNAVELRDRMMRLDPRIAKFLVLRV